MPLDDFGDLQVAALLSVGGFEHRKRAGKARAPRAVPVEPVHDQDVPPGDQDEFGLRHIQARTPGKAEFEFLSARNVPLVAASSRELRDRLAPR